MDKKKEMTADEIKELIRILKERFEKNKQRHENMDWETIETKLNLNVEKLWSLNEMEKTGGEPDVVSYDAINAEFLFVDCAKESPIGRRSLCYDKEALEKRKNNKPKNSAIVMASEMGIDLLTESQYRELQELGSFDEKTSSWIKTPVEIRKLGGALFCDCRYKHVFVYHNGAESYYSARGFRGCLRI